MTTPEKYVCIDPRAETFKYGGIYNRITEVNWVRNEILSREGTDVRSLCSKVYFEIAFVKYSTITDKQ